MPRPYQPGPRRLAARAETRSKIIDAARAVLASPQPAAFSIDVVAERANVARMTVYYQFKSKGKLLEALFDDIAVRTDMRQIQRAFHEADVRRSLEIIIDVFCRLWETEGKLLRRLTALAALDSDVDRALKKRGEWRGEALANILARKTDRGDARELVIVLHAITSLETYMSLREASGRTEVRRILKQAANALVRSF